MFKRIILGLACCLLLATCGINPYNQAQYSECFTNYSTAFNACNGNEGCEGDALDAYQVCTGENAKIPLHFVVLTDKLGDELSTPVNNVLTRNFLKNQVDTLNRYFTVEDARYPPDNRKKIVTFEYKSSTLYNVATTINDPIVDFADPTFNFDRRHEDFKPNLNSSANPLLYDPTALNIYIVDCVNAAGGNIVSSHGNNNSNKPYIVLDYARITGVANRQAAQEHEMGHAFGLGHECDPNATTSTSTNIMASKSNCVDSNGNESSGGLRDIGFTPGQCNDILEKVTDFIGTSN